jgi:hypothetical protein
MRLLHGMAVHHFRALRKLTPTDCNVCAYANRFQTQAFEEPEPEDGIGAQDLAYKHLFVMHLENLDDEI